MVVLQSDKVSLMVYSKYDKKVEYIGNLKSQYDLIWL